MSNSKRLASLFRELAESHQRTASVMLEIAEAFGAPEPAKKPRRTVVVPPATEVSPEAEAAARRALRKQGVAA